MSMEELEPILNSDHILDWLEDTISVLPSFFDDPYNSINDISGFQWWDDQDEQDHLFINPPLINTTNNTINIPIPTTTITTTTSLTNSPSPSSNFSNKRKSLGNPSPQTSLNNQNQRRRFTKESTTETVIFDVRRTVVRPAKKPTTKSTGTNCGNNKEGRWAEQLLNPCALAITTGNLTRVQHLLYVLQELASASGDANQRLASHGLRALTHYLSSNSTSSSPIDSTPPTPFTFASTEPRSFQRSLLKFYEVSPWFTFGNTIANASILQILAQESDSSRNLHILDIGVSHGIQWPTLLEALSRRSGGPPPLVRITIINSNSENNPFTIGPPGDDYTTRLLRFAKSINLNLQIKRLTDQPLQTLNPQIMNTSPNETLIVSTQFRLHNLNHKTPDDRSEFFRILVSLNPSGVILNENDIECSCNQCGDFNKGFSRRVEYLWRFMDSTSSAFKGRECEERRMVEGEAARVLMNHRGEMNEGREIWFERMRGVGFVREGFGEDAIDGGRALLRKYDSNWEMRMVESNVHEKARDGGVGSVCLGWKGQPVSFCSLWKLKKSITLS